MRRLLELIARETQEKVPVGQEPRRRRWEGPTREVIRGNGRLREAPMLTRYRLFKTPRGGLYVHHWHRPDADKDCHDHPWVFWSLILKGGYTEELRRPATNPSPLLMVRQRFSLHRTSLSDAHRVRSLEPDTWTLLWVGRRQQDWGFYLHDLGPDTVRARIKGPAVLAAARYRAAADTRLPIYVPWQSYIAAGGNPDPFVCA